MKQYGFYVDSSRCSGCKTCQVSCKDNKDLDVGPKLRRVYEYGGGSWVKEGESWHHDTFTYYLSIACNHCDEPVCVSGCPTGAMHKRKEDGLVVVDDSVCVGCRYCEMRCPYGAPQFDTQANVMRKCDVLTDWRTICALFVWILARSERWISALSMNYGQNMARRIKSRRYLRRRSPILTSLLNRIRKRDPRAIRKAQS